MFNLSSNSLENNKVKSESKNVTNNYSTPLYGILNSYSSSNSTFGSTDYAAIDDYYPENGYEVNLLKNDPVKVLKVENDCVCILQNVRTGQTGFAPIYLVKENSDINWFFPDISPQQAERLLEYMTNETGVYLVRESTQEKGNYSLSVLFVDKKGNRKVGHYKINKTEEEKLYLLDKNYQFSSLQDLINYYKSNKGICCLLTQPCPKQFNFNSLGDVWEEPRENLASLDKIAQREMCNSGQITVYKGIWRKKHTVAIKEIRWFDEIVDSSQKREALLSAFDKMKMLRHKNIVKLWCVCTRTQPYLLVTEYMKNGSLLKYLREDGGKRVGFEHIVNIACQIAAGMKYLEQFNFVYRDLAAKNILIDENNNIKIGDFITSFLTDENDEQLSIRWHAPELFFIDSDTRKRAYSTKSDVWAFGILLYELITKGGIPYAEMTNKEIFEEVVGKQYKMPRPETSENLCTNDYYDVMLKCWKYNPDDRPMFASLLHILENFDIYKKSYKKTVLSS